jgi:hypothetical protein
MDVSRFLMSHLVIDELGEKSTFRFMDSIGLGGFHESYF